MSQRGGSVVTYVRFGDKVYSPVIDKGEADYILSFEKLEALRWIEYLKIGGQIITNTQEVDPMPVITGAMQYPDNIIEKLESAGAKVDAKDFLSIAEEAGSAKAVNIVLMGRLSDYFKDIPYEVKCYPIKPEAYRIVGLATQNSEFMAPAVSTMYQYIIEHYKQKDEVDV